MSNRRIVAAGGGGAEYSACNGTGGAGGGLSGNGGTESGGGGHNGQGGTQVGGGAGGIGGYNGGAGTLGQGGVAGNHPAGHAGGGGGGYFGGGGSSEDGHGGGGSSYVGGVSGGVTTTGVQAGDGQVVLTWNGTSCSASSRVPVTVTVNTLSTAPTSISGTTTICNGSTTALSAVGGSLGTGATYNWYTGSCGGTGAGTGATNTVGPTGATTYFVRAQGACNTTSCASVTVNVSQVPTVANAGPDQNLCSTSTTLAANAAAVGTGNWSIVSGSGGNIISPNSPTSTFTGISGSTYTLRWTISNAPCTPTSDDVVIAFTPNPTPANAGPDQSICGATATLAANSPSIGTGSWSIISGAGGSITAGSNPSSSFTGTQGTSYTLRWTTANAPCASSTDDVIINFVNIPTTANAGPDQTLCANNTTLAANTPTNGTGAWSIISGAGGTVTTPSSPTSAFTGTQGSTYILRWTTSNAPCAATTDDVQVVMTPNPTVANAGADQTICTTITTLAGNSPSIGTGSWSILSGAGGAVTVPTSPTSTFTGLQGNTYTLRWSISNAPCPASTDNMVITITNNPTNANAGVDQVVCATSTTLAATVPGVGSGSWSIVSGAGGIITTPTSATSNFSGVTGTAYTLRWTVSNPPCANSTDDMQVYFSPAPTTANAGPDQTLCATSANLSSNTPGVGSGSWSIISGAGGSITAPNSPNSGFTGVQGTTYTLRWTIANAPCTASTDNVLITFTSFASAANAGVDQTLCSTSTSMAATVPAIGTGAWSVVSGTGGTVVTPGSATSAFNGVLGTNYTLRWTVSNAPCPSTTDDVLVNMVANPTAANAGPDQILCTNSTTLAGNTPAVGSGAWSTVSGTGGTIVNPSIPASPFTLTPGIVYTLRWTISNAPCASTSDDVVVRIETTPPAITCPANIVTPNNQLQCSAVVNYTSPVGTDNCPNPTTTQIAGLQSGAVFPPGVTTNTFRVTDGFGNSTTCSFTVTVTDAQVPVITCPSNITTVSDSAQCTATLSYATPVGTDNCPNPTTTQVSGLPSGGAFPLGTTVNTFSVVDAVGNSASCSFSVVVSDNQGPTIVCPPSITAITANGLCDQVVTYSSPVGNDNCAGASTVLIQGLASGSTFPIGVTTNVFRITDGASNAATCAFSVTVNDGEQPTITCPANMLVGNSPSTCAAVVTYPSPVSADNCIGFTMARISGLASGASFPVGVTTTVFQVMDASSNTATRSFTVTVEDNETPVAVCQNITLQLDSSGIGILDANLLNSGSTDNCSALTATAMPNSFTCADLGFQNVTLTMTDQSGNSSTCNAQIRIVPSPVVIALSAQTFSCGYHTSCFAASDGVATAVGSGGCPGYTYHWSNGQNTAVATGLGGGTHTVTVTDASGGFTVNTITLTAPPPFVVTTAPTASCANATTGTITTTSAGGNDCQSHSYLWSNGGTTASLTGLAPGIYNLTVTDGGGCTVTRSVTVGTLPTPNPVFTQSGNTLTSTQTWTTYQWMLNGSAIPGANSSTYVIAQSGNYSLSVTGSNDCQGTSAEENITFVGMADPSNSWSGLSIYPNPARDEFRLRTDSPIAYGFTVKMTDMYGRLLSTRELHHLSNEEAFSIKDLAAGTYFVEVISAKGLHKSFKLVVQ